MSVQDAARSSERSVKIAPRWFVLSAATVPLGILGQFMLAGLSLSVDLRFQGMHDTLGFLLAVPIGVVATAPFLRNEVKALRHWTGLLGILYLLQIVLAAAGSGLAQAVHVLNAGLLLVVAPVVVAKIARSHNGG
ncbi:DUF6220 domain-containing protein [Mesorhizobium sp. 1B3]|uniref:DUF6220 domain-containing protein n=1 Tax=Mesorhizobium sp. 1B3 TaxID=3243599 RepID=UPI003D991BA5